MNTRKGFRVAAMAIFFATVGACSGGSNSNDGIITVSMMDRAVDGISELNITVTEFWVKPQGNGPAFQLDMVETPVTVNLLELSADDPAVFIVALGHVVKHKGLAQLAEDTGLNRESLYKTFNGKVQPKWDTVHRLMKAIKVELAIAA